jgi:hypothetical protein
MSYQRKRVTEEARAQASGATAPRKRDATDVLWPRDLAHAFVFNRPSNDRDDDATTIFEREQELQDADILSDDDHALAVEGSLARSIMPHGSSWRRRATWALSSVGLLAAIAVWSSDWRSWASPRERQPTLRAVPLAHGEPVAQAVVPAPVAQPVAAPTEPEPAAISGTVDETPAIAEEPAIGKRHSRHHGSGAHKAKWHARAKTPRAKHGSAIARRIEPLPEPTTAEEAGEVTIAADNEGTLQINSRPWARIVVDGSFVGHTPQLALHLAAGKHHVQLVNDEMEMSKAIDVTIAAGQTIKRIETLEDNTSPN